MPGQVFFIRFCICINVPRIHWKCCFIVPALSSDRVLIFICTNYMLKCFTIQLVCLYAKYICNELWLSSRKFFNNIYKYCPSLNKYFVGGDNDVYTSTCFFFFFFFFFFFWGGGGEITLHCPIEVYTFIKTNEKETYFFCLCFIVFVKICSVDPTIHPVVLPVMASKQWW